MALTAEEEKFVKDLYKVVVVEMTSSPSFARDAIKIGRANVEVGPYALTAHSHMGAGGLTADDVRTIINGSAIVAPL